MHVKISDASSSLATTSHTLSSTRLPSGSIANIPAAFALHTLPEKQSGSTRRPPGVVPIVAETSASGAASFANQRNVTDALLKNK